MSATQGLQGRFDLVVIGGGINGTGIARDASRRGLKVLLVEKEDLAAGTTSWSSRLIHGGLRYLEHGEIPLVYESLQERERLLHNAPHLVHPLAMTLPLYDRNSRGPLTIRAGMIAYDILSWKKTLPRHTMFNSDGARAHERGLNTDGLKGAARYYDAQVEFPERICVENALDAEAHGAVIRTHTRVTGIRLEAGVVRGVSMVDDVSGDELAAETSVIANVAGPWVDELLVTAGIEQPGRPLLGVTRGTHIVVEPFRGAPSDALYVEANSDGRPYFIIPWNGLYLIGTTDERYDGDPDAIAPNEDEITYLLNEANTVIPAANLTRASVCYAYAGLRPLPFQGKGSESGITRRHIIHNHAPAVRGLLSIIGGKLTTFRNLSEQVVDAVSEIVPTGSGSDTASAPLPGGEGFGPDFVSRFVRNRPEWLSDASALALTRVYGSRADQVIDLAQSDESLRAPLGESTPLIAATVAFAVRSEFARTLSDVVMRRTTIGYAADAGFGSIDGVADVMQRELGWNQLERDDAVQDHRKGMEKFLPRARDMATAL